MAGFGMGTQRSGMCARAFSCSAECTNEKRESERKRQREREREKRRARDNPKPYTATFHPKLLNILLEISAGQGFC